MPRRESVNIETTYLLTCELILMIIGSDDFDWD